MKTAHPRHKNMKSQKSERRRKLIFLLNIFLPSTAGISGHFLGPAQSGLVRVKSGILFSAGPAGRIYGPAPKRSHGLLCLKIREQYLNSFFAKTSFGYPLPSAGAGSRSVRPGSLCPLQFLLFLCFSGSAPILHSRESLVSSP